MLWHDLLWRTPVLVTATAMHTCICALHVDSGFARVAGTGLCNVSVPSLLSASLSLLHPCDRALETIRMKRKPSRDGKVHQVIPVVPYDIVGQMMVQCCRQPGLAEIALAFLDFGGQELYFREWVQLQGKTFGQAMYLFDHAIPIGVKVAAAPNSRNGTVMLNPPMTTSSLPETASSAWRLMSTATAHARASSCPNPCFQPLQPPLHPRETPHPLGLWLPRLPPSAPRGPARR